MSRSVVWLSLGLLAGVWMGGATKAAMRGAKPLQVRRMYRNPILFADYSDPDVIRDGSSYYLIASSFHFVPGIPILRSTDLVHWTIEGHVVERLTMDPRYSMIGGNRYGGGVWAPAIRRHAGRFYVYFPTPQEGIFVSTATKISGPWSAPVAVIDQPGLEDPCPFWDDDGTAWLIHSRVGAGPLILHRMSPDGLHVLDGGRVIVSDPKNLPVLEGPKLYKRNGYYYIFAPFGGVGTGAQAVLRSRNIYGPYEHRVVLVEGSTNINGPHQGGYVETPDGQGWFVHFQATGAHGRIVHLEPVHWEDDWPVIGEAPQGAAAGEPVRTAPMPDDGLGPPLRPQTSDDFGSPVLNPQWEWNHNPEDAHWSLSTRPGYLRLIPMPAGGLLDARNTLTQTMQDDSFVFTVRLDLTRMTDGVHTGLAMFEKDASGLEIRQTGAERRLSYFHLADLHDSNKDPGIRFAQNVVQLRVEVQADTARYSYSLDDGATFLALGEATKIHGSWWKGTRPALFAYSTGGERTDPGPVDFDWAHYQPKGVNPW